MSDAALHPGPGDHAGTLLKGRFPVPLMVVDCPEWTLPYVVGLAEALNRRRPPLVEPDRVAAAFVARQAESGWRAVGGEAPGDEAEQRRALDALVNALAQHLSKRAGERAVNRRELVVEDLRFVSAVPAVAGDQGDPARTVVARMDFYRELRRLHGLLTSPAQRRYLAALVKRPDLWDSVGVHGESTFVGEQLGLSSANVRQLHSRIQVQLRRGDGPEAA